MKSKSCISIGSPKIELRLLRNSSCRPFSESHRGVPVPSLFFPSRGLGSASKSQYTLQRCFQLGGFHQLFLGIAFQLPERRFRPHLPEPWCPLRRAMLTVQVNSLRRHAGLDELPQCLRSTHHPLVSPLLIQTLFQMSLPALTHIHSGELNRREMTLFGDSSASLVKI